MSPERVEPPLPVLADMKALITGIANEHSIAYGCAKASRELGADLAVTYATEKSKPHVEPLASELGAQLLLPLDVGDAAQLQSVFDQIGQRWGRLDILLHSVALAPKDDLQGGLLRCSGEGFARDGHFVSFVRTHGGACRAAHGRGRHAANDELLRCPKGRAEQ